MSEGDNEDVHFMDTVKGHVTGDVTKMLQECLLQLHQKQLEN